MLLPLIFTKPLFVASPHDSASKHLAVVRLAFNLMRVNRKCLAVDPAFLDFLRLPLVQKSFFAMTGHILL
jgi:hypothetical protein